MSASYRRWCMLAGCCAVVLLAGGCVHKYESGGEKFFEYELWVPLSVLFGGLAAAPIGWVMRENAGRIAWALLIGGPIAALLFAPSLACDQVVVGKERFHVRTGIWGLTAVHDVEFSQIRQIRITAETSTSRRGRRTSYYLNCDTASGTEKVGINNAVTEAAAPAILAEATDRGIPILDQTGGE